MPIAPNGSGAGSPLYDPTGYPPPLLGESPADQSSNPTVTGIIASVTQTLADTPVDADAADSTGDSLFSVALYVFIAVVVLGAALLLYCNRRKVTPASTFTSISFGEGRADGTGPPTTHTSDYMLMGKVASEDSDDSPAVPVRRRVAGTLSDDDDDSEELVAPTRQRAGGQKRGGSSHSESSSGDADTSDGATPRFRQVDDDDDDDTTEGSDADFEADSEDPASATPGPHWRQKVLDLDSESTDTAGSTPRYLQVDACPSPHAALNGTYELAPDVVLDRHVWTKGAGVRVTYHESRSWVLGGQFAQKSKWAAPRAARAWTLIGDPPPGSSKQCGDTVLVTRVRDVAHLVAVVVTAAAAAPLALQRAAARRQDVAILVSAALIAAAAAADDALIQHRRVLQVQHAAVACAATAVVFESLAAEDRQVAAAAAVAEGAAGHEHMSSESDDVGVADPSEDGVEEDEHNAASLSENGSNADEVAIGSTPSEAGFEPAPPPAVRVTAPADDDGDDAGGRDQPRDGRRRSTLLAKRASVSELVAEELQVAVAAGGASEDSAQHTKEGGKDHSPRDRSSPRQPPRWRRLEPDSGSEYDADMLANTRVFASPIIEAVHDAGEGLDMFCLSGAMAMGFDAPAPHELAAASTRQPLPLLSPSAASPTMPGGADGAFASVASMTSLTTPRDKWMVFSPTALHGGVHPYHRPPSVLQEVEDAGHLTNHPDRSVAMEPAPRGASASAGTVTSSLQAEGPGDGADGDGEPNEGEEVDEAASPREQQATVVGGVYQRVKAELEQKTDEVHELRAAADAAREAMRQLEEDLRTAKCDSNELHNRVALLEEDAARSREEVERGKERVEAEKLAKADLEAELAQADSARETTNRSLRSLAEMNDTMGLQCQSLMAEVAAQNAQMREMEDTNRALAREVKTLKASEGDTRAAKDAAKTAAQMCETLRASNRAMANRVRELEAWCERKTKFVLSARLKVDSSRMREMKLMHEHDLVSPESVFLTSLPRMFAREAAGRAEILRLQGLLAEELMLRHHTATAAFSFLDGVQGFHPFAPVERERRGRSAVQQAAADGVVEVLATRLRALTVSANAAFKENAEITGKQRATAELLVTAQRDLELALEDLREEQELTALKVDNAVATTRRECREEYEQTLNCKENKYRSNEDELRSLQPQLADALAELDAVRADLQQAQQGHATALHNQFLAHTAEVSALKADVSRAKEALGERDVAFDDLTHRSQRAKAKFLAEKKSWEGLEGRLAAARSELSATKTQLVGMECERKDMKSDIRHLQRTVKGLETQRDHLEELLGEAKAEQQRYVDAGWGVLAGEGGDADDGSVDGSSPRKSRAGSLPGVAAGDMHKLPAGPLAELVRLREDKAALETKLEEAKKAWKEQRAVLSEHEVLLRQKDEDVATLEATVRRKIDPLRSEVEALNRSLEEKGERIRALEESNATLAASAADNDKRATTADAEAKRQRRKRKALATEIDSLRTDYMALKEKYTALVELPPSFLAPSPAAHVLPSPGMTPPEADGGDLMLSKTDTSVFQRAEAQPAAPPQTPDQATKAILERLDVEDVVGALRGENSRLRQASTLLENRIKALEGQVAEMEKMRVAGEGDARRLRRALEKAELELRPLKIEVDLYKKQEADKLGELKGRVADLERDKVRYEAKVARLSQVNAEWESRGQDGVLDAFRKENIALKNRVALAEDTARDQLQEAKKTLNQRTQQLEDARHKVSQLEARLAESENPFGAPAITPVRGRASPRGSIAAAGDVPSPTAHGEVGDLVGPRFAGPASSSRVVLIQIRDDADGEPMGGATVDDIAPMLSRAADVPREWFQVLAHTSAPRGAYLRLKCDERDVPQPAANKTLNAVLEKLPACFMEAECQQLADVVDVLSTELSHTHERARQLEWQRKKLEHEVLLSHIRPPAPPAEAGPSPLELVVSLDSMARRVDSCISACRKSDKQRKRRPADGGTNAHDTPPTRIPAADEPMAAP